MMKCASSMSAFNERQAYQEGLVSEGQSSFTPGPWTADPDRRPGWEWNWHVYAGRDDRICFMANTSPDVGLAGANARLIAAAPDHALICWAMCVQDATWDEWGPGKGEFCFAGLRHATTLDEFGAPVLTDHLRALLTQARGQ
jgi:hypothetical protein